VGNRPWLDDVGGATGVSGASFIVETTHDDTRPSIYDDRIRLNNENVDQPATLKS